MKKKTKKILGVWSFGVYAFFYIPILILIIYSFNDSKISTSWNGFTFSWYSKLATNEALIASIINSLIVASISTGLSLVIGTCAAMALKRYNFPGKKFIDLLFYVPIVIPPIIIGVSMLVLFAWLNISLSLTTVIPGHVVLSTSFVTLLVLARLHGFDLSLEEAAKDLGANGWQTFWKITFPLILPSIIAGGLLSFTISIDEFVIAFFTTGPGSNTLPVMIYSIVRTGITPEINALSTIMIMVTVVVVFLGERWRGSLGK